MGFEDEQRQEGKGKEKVMSSLATNVSPRKFEIPVSTRSYGASVSVRNFTSSVSKRDFGVAIVGWRLWGQTNIHPFQVGGEDSTKTFGELP